jgi:hypothetical protein
VKTADFGPGFTPTIVKWFIIVASTVSIVSGLLQGILSHLGIFPGPQELLSLSWWGISKSYFWQPLTFALVQDVPFNDVTFSFFVGVIINMYIFWVVGSAMETTLGLRSFAKFLVICTMFSGLITMSFLRLVENYDLITGMTSVVIILLTAWAMKFPNAMIFLFLLIPMNSLVVAMTLIITIILYSLVEGYTANVLLYMVAVLVTYLYAIIVWGWRSPFEFMSRIDEWLLSFRAKFTHELPILTKGDESDAVIIDIDTGKPTLEDEAFVEEMLTKISKSGEDSLSWRERQRLQKISEKKKSSKG